MRVARGCSSSIFSSFSPLSLEIARTRANEKKGHARGVRLAVAGQLLVTCGPIMRRSGPPLRCVQPPAGVDRARAHLYEAPAEPNSPCAALVDATRPVPPGRACPRGSLGITENISPACSAAAAGAYDCEVPDPQRPNHTIDPLPLLVSWTSTTTCNRRLLLALIAADERLSGCAPLLLVGLVNSLTHSSFICVFFRHACDVQN